MSAPESQTEDRPQATLLSVASLFLRLGITAFGGPAVHIALMEEEIVRRRGWLTHEAFLDMLGVTNLIPGPNSTEMAMHVGLKKGGVAGLLAGGLGFILPASLLTLVLGWLYLRYGRLPEIQPFLEGVQPAIVAVLAGAVWRLGRSASKTRGLLAVGLLAALAMLLGANEILLLFAGGAAGMLWERLRAGRRNQRSFTILIPFQLWTKIGFVSQKSLLAAVGVAAAASAPFAAPSALQIGLYFLKIGAVLYGSGYVLVAFLQGGLVERLHWLTQSQLFDAIAIGQITPGPLSCSATFIGYILGGLQGAFAATLGMFLPGFVFVFIFQPLIPRLRANRWASSFLDAVNVTAVGLMAGVTVEFARHGLATPRGFILGVAAAVAVLILRLNSALVIIGAALINWLIVRMMGA